MPMAAGQVICCALGIACTSKADGELHSVTSLLMLFAKQLVKYMRSQRLITHNSDVCQSTAEWLP